MKQLLCIPVTAMLLSACAFKQHDVSIYDNKRHLASQLSQDEAGWLTYSDGNKYHGERDGAFAQGQGELIRTDGTRISGAFVKGKPQGHVTIKFQNGDTYQGLYSDEYPNGEGVFKHASGKVRSGDFVNGILQRGELITPAGDRYQGEFENEMLQGEGMVLITTPGDRYEGPFKQGIKHGWFVKTSPDSTLDRYQLWEEGSLAFDLPGPATLKQTTWAICPDSSKALISGTCPADNATSSLTEATLYHKASNTLIRGQFGSSELVTGLKFNLDNQTLDQGEWLNDRLQGMGAIYHDGQLVYEGEFDQGKRHGLGICIIADAPIECEHYQGQRVDTGYMRQALNADLAELSQEHRQTIAEIKAATQRQRQQYDQQYRARLKQYERDIESAENQGMAQGMMSTTSALLNGASDQQARAIAQVYIDRIEGIRQKIEREKQDYARTQASREEAWYEEQKRTLESAGITFKAKEQSIVQAHALQCEQIPGKHWNQVERLCES